MNLRLVFSLLITFVAIPAQALHIEFVAEDNVLILAETIQLKSGQTLGQLTAEVLRRRQAKGELTYVGDEGGLSAINAWGSKQVQVDARTLHFYGWCYEVDGEVRSELAGELLLTSSQSSVKWFYAYVVFHAQTGEWGEMCVPAKN